MKSTGTLKTPRFRPALIIGFLILTLPAPFAAFSLARFPSP